MTGEIPVVVEGVVAACLLVGALFVFIGSLGLIRMRAAQTAQYDMPKVDAI